MKYVTIIALSQLSFKQFFQNNWGWGNGYKPKEKAEANNPYRDLDYSGYYKNRI